MHHYQMNIFRFNISIQGKDGEELELTRKKEGFSFFSQAGEDPTRNLSAAHTSANM